jgi:hypothetical protein
MVEIRTYDGDGDDLAELCAAIRRQDGGDEDWVPLWDAAYFRRQIQAPAADRELMVAAYDGSRLVGSFFAVPYEFNFRGQLLPGTFSTCFMVDTAYRALGPYLIEKLRRRHRDNEIAFSVGFDMGGPNSASHLCWANYAKLSPQNCRHVADVGYWFATLDPTVFDDGASDEERALVDSFLAGQSRKDTSGQTAPDETRAYRQSDLADCLDCLKGQVGDADWAVHWDEERLAVLLGSPEYGQATVIERAGQVCGFVSFHLLPLWNGAPYRGAILDLLATRRKDPLLSQQLLSAAHRQASEAGVQVMMTLRSAMFRARNMVPSGFLPLPATGRLVILFANQELHHSPSDDIEVILR